MSWRPPATSPTGDGLDIAGYPMEGYKEGELRGGISVTIPVREQVSYLDSSAFLELEKRREAETLKTKESAYGIKTTP
ncbi:MAG: hypothetical protein QMD05_07235 [Candidatus Brocadiaceae bacterium]|nr:hypothetical protein [Candidatus Brocadiaceae bacterium]